VQSKGSVGCWSNPLNCFNERRQSNLSCNMLYYTNANWQLQYQLLKTNFANHANLGGPENARRPYIYIYTHIHIYIYMHIQNCVVIKCAWLYLYVNPLIIYVFFSSRVHGHPTWRLRNDYMYYMWLWKPNILMVLHTVDGSKIQL